MTTEELTIIAQRLSDGQMLQRHIDALRSTLNKLSLETYQTRLCVSLDEKYGSPLCYDSNKSFYSFMEWKDVLPEFGDEMLTAITAVVKRHLDVLQGRYDAL